VNADYLSAAAASSEDHRPNDDLLVTLNVLSSE
jgi:hypothetical protein